MPHPFIYAPPPHASPSYIFSNPRVKSSHESLLPMDFLRFFFHLSYIMILKLKCWKLLNKIGYTEKENRRENFQISSNPRVEKILYEFLRKFL